MRLWWAVDGFPNNHNYVLRDGNQHCHLCDEIEPPLRQPTDNERVNRAAMHLVHGVRYHLNVTDEEWNG
jgi:hypothetical protein